jgi:hypothetical protein
MDSWGRSNLSSLRDAVSSSSSLAPTSIQRQPSLQEQSETQIPFVSSTEPHDTTPPSPDVVSNEPALWQLGRHSYYKPSNEYDQQPKSLSGQPVFGFTEGDGHGRASPGHPHPQVNKVDEAGLRDVEEELHRGLQARQVRMQSVFRACWLLNDHHRFQ